MWTLTPSERRGALVVVVVLALGAGHDLWRAAHPDLRPLASGPRIRAGGGEAMPADSTAAAGAEGPAGSPALDLNRASAAELDQLPGIGPVLAARIVSYRSEHGRFSRVEELRAVRGVGPRVLERLRPHLRVGAEAAGPPTSRPVARSRANRNVP